MGYSIKCLKNIASICLFSFKLFTKSLTMGINCESQDFHEIRAVVHIKYDESVDGGIYESI